MDVHVGENIMSATFVPQGNQSPKKPDVGGSPPDRDEEILLPDGDTRSPDFGNGRK